MLRNALACLFAAAILITASSVLHAQDAPPDQPAEETPQQKAQRLFKEGLQAEEAKDYAAAIAKFEAAYEAFNDPLIYIRIGQAYQLKGLADTDYDSYKKAVEAYQKYLEIVPDGGDPTVAETVNTRITQLETAIAEEEDRKKKQAEEEKQAKIEEARLKREEAERARKEKEKLEGMRPAIDAMVVAGLDQDASLAARLIAGGFIGWKRFGLEAHIGFEGFFPLASDIGTSGRSLTLIDLGFRFGNGEDNYTGIFASAGGGFGLFGGDPRERRLEDDMETCAGFGEPDAPNNCKFDVDKNITGRFGLGYGFAASRKTTVAARLDFTYWLLSVDGEQSVGSVPAARVSKPVQGFSVLLGLEFMRWL